MSKKLAVAEVLYNLPESTLTTNQIRWIMSHLPDTDEMGENGATSKEIKKLEPVKWNHSKSSLYKAFGMDDISKVENIITKIEDVDTLLKRSNSNLDIKKSMIIEGLRPNLTETELCFVLCLGMNGLKNYMIDEMKLGIGEVLSDRISTGDARKDIKDILSSLQSQSVDQQIVGPGNLEDMLDALEAGRGKGAISDERGELIQFKNLEEFKNALIKRLEKLRDDLKRERDGK